MAPEWSAIRTFGVLDVPPTDIPGAADSRVERMCPTAGLNPARNTSSETPIRPGNRRRRGQLESRTLADLPVLITARLNGCSYRIAFPTLKM
jgi:hypothetical protein